LSGCPPPPVRKRGPVAVLAARALDDDHPAAVAGGLSAPAQDRAGLVIVPVVEHVAEHVRVTAGGQGIEEALPGERAAPVQAPPVQASPGQASPGQVLPAPLDGVGQVDQRAANLRVRVEDGGQQRAGAAADVDDVARAGPVVAGGRVGHVLRPGGHGRVERGAHRRIGGQVRPERRAEDRLPGGLPGAQGVQEPGERQVHPPAEPVEVQRDLHPGRVIRAQQRREVVEPERARVRLGEHAMAGQVRQQPAQGIGIAA
jgi:hypothetical protein